METIQFNRHRNDYHKVCSFRVDSFIFIYLFNRNGRRLFPNFHISVHALDPDIKYTFLLDIVPMDDNRYKYQESSWVISGKAEPHMYGR